MDRIEELKQQAEGAVYEAISVGQFLGEEKQMKAIDLLTLGLLKEKNKYDKLKISHVKLVKVIEAAIRIKDIWTLPTNEACFHNEAVALQTMRTNFEQALKEAKEII